MDVQFIKVCKAFLFVIPCSIPTLALGFCFQFNVKFSWKESVLC